MLREVKVKNGWVRGIPAADPRITSFKGIPFAAPPVGDLRWKAPQPAADWDGVRECYTFAPISMQHVPGLDPDNIYTREWNVDPTIPMSEDCLYLNVWTPAKAADEKLPVLVWYFGGGLREGNTAEMEFDGERIARRGIVVVSVNYRLNVFGFLAHPELIEESPEAPANFGHLDQQFGTRWVKENIAAFGGDPDNITIAGQSAGGMSVSAQLASPQNEGLFQRAIIMSGIGLNAFKHQRRPFGSTYEEALERGKEFFKFLGVETLAEARKIDEVTLRDRCEEFGGMWGSVADGKFLTGAAGNQVIDGDRWQVPLMIGCTVGETRFGIDAKDMDELRAHAEADFGDRADEFLAIVGDDLEKARAMSKINGAEIAVRAMREYMKQSGKDTPVYFYKFNPEMPGWDNPGTFHSSDLWFWFETLAKCWRPFVGKHYDLARHMCNYWANYFRCGDPNGNDADGTPMPEWKPFTLEEQNGMYLGDAATPYVDEDSKLMDFLVKLYMDGKI